MIDRFPDSASSPMRVSVIAAGSMLIDHSQMLWNEEPGKVLRHPVCAVLIEHPEGRLLIDTGFDIDRLMDVLPSVEPQVDCDRPLETALARRNLALADVDYLIHTHLHFDHVGADRLLPAATMFVHKEEMRHAKVPEAFEQLSYFDQQFDHPGLSRELLEGDVEVLPGVFLLETPGHSAGHYSVLLRGRGGRELLVCGDAAYSAANLERRVVAGFHLDPVESLRSIDRLRRIAERPPVAVIFPHDGEALKSYRVSPECYEL